MDAIFRFFAALLELIGYSIKRADKTRPPEEREIAQVQEAATNGDEKTVQSTFALWRRRRRVRDDRDS